MGTRGAQNETTPKVKTKIIRRARPRAHPVGRRGDRMAGEMIPTSGKEG